MGFYDYYNFICEVNKTKMRLGKGFYKARMALVALQDKLNYELAARVDE